MSGERVILAADADGGAMRLVHVAGRLERLEIRHYAVIGGLAVMCRLATVHRATQDLDTVTETTVPSTVEVITSSIGAASPVNENRVVIDGVNVDVIDTEVFDADDLVGIDPGGRLFVVSHRWALETARVIDVVVGSESASIRVATAPALVAMKAGAVLGGRPRAPHKRASDLYDLYRLVLDHDRNGAIGDALSAAPFGLGHLVADALRARVIDEPERAARRLIEGGGDLATVTAEHLDDVLGPLVDHLSDA